MHGKSSFSQQRDTNSTIRDLLTEAWTADLLRTYFTGKPVADWFNKAAPKVKSGEIKPDGVDAETALALMLAEPILIRRPLMEAGGRRNVGFDPQEVEAWIGLEKAHAAPADLETCRRKSAGFPNLHPMPLHQRSEPFMTVAPDQAASAAETILAYHQRTKHSLQRYAAGRRRLIGICSQILSANMRMRRVCFCH